jgi:hypothetical protein
LLGCRVRHAAFTPVGESLMAGQGESMRNFALVNAAGKK